MTDTTTSAEAPPEDERPGRLDAFFEITKRGTSWWQEVRGGLVTFVTMAYIIVLNPIILSSGKDVLHHGLNFDQVAAVTALTAGVMTILFGLIAKLPFAFAAGLGINSFLAVSVVKDVTWPEAMGLVVIDGLIIVILSATGLRRLIFDAVPYALKISITVGIGLFIAFIGLVDAGFVRTTGDPSPPIGLGIGGSITSIPTAVFVLTLLITGILMARKVKGAILIGLVSGTILAVIAQAIWHLGDQTKDPNGWNLNIPQVTNWVSLPDFGLIGQVSFDFSRVGALTAIMLVFTLVFSNFFDAMGTMTGLSKEAGLANADGTFPRLRSALIVEGVGAVAGGLTSGSSNTVFIESGAGIGEGARTGFANVITGVLFLLAMFFTPVAQIVPSEVAAAALVIVGALMMSQIKSIDLTDFRVLLPVFVTVVIMPLTYSIANGIGAGFITWVVVQAFSGKVRTISPLLWIVAAGFAIYFARGPIESLFPS